LLKSLLDLLSGLVQGQRTFEFPFPSRLGSLLICFSDYLTMLFFDILNLLLTSHDKLQLSLDLLSASFNDDFSFNSEEL
jgi:hypothetical protein